MYKELQGVGPTLRGVERRETKKYLICPDCDRSIGSIDHLSVGSIAGTWYCDDPDGCGAGWNLHVIASGIISIRRHSRKIIKTKDTLVLPPQSKPVYFEVEGMAFVDHDSNLDDGDDPLDGKFYFYEEHTCPKNWFKHVEKIRIGDDHDPHGLFKLHSSALMDNNHGMD